MGKKIILIIALVLISVFALINIFDVINTDEETIDKEFTYSINNISTNMKEIHMLSKREQDIICATSKGLIEMDSKSNIKPSLATGAEISQDGIEYNFIINDNVYWSDGKKITGDDIVSFFRELIISQPKEEIEALYEVYGVSTFINEGKVDFDKKVGISAKGNKVSIRLNKANENFLKEISMPQYRVRKNIEQWSNLGANYKEIVYSGYYYIEEFSENKIALVKSKRETEKIIKRINILKEVETEMAMAYFEVGDRDIVVNPPRSQLNKLVKDNKVITVPSDETMYLSFNLDEEVLPIEGRKDIYNMFTKLMQEYQVKNTNFMELADGSYFREEKENIEKLQERKVMSNNISEWKEKDVIYILAENTAQNKEFCDFVAEWFSKNSKMSVVYNLVDRNTLETGDTEAYYDITLIEGNRNIEDNQSFYKQLSSLLPDKYGELFVDKDRSAYESVFKSIEDDLFNNYILLPLAFYNNNIAINKEEFNVELDINENIIFSSLKNNN